MWAYIDSLFSLLFPKSEDEANIEDASPETFVLKLHIQNFSGITTLSLFKDKQVRSAIHLAKFHHSQKATILLSTLLETYLRSLPEKSYTLIPIPLSPKRKRERGYNQVEVISREAVIHISYISIDTTSLRRDKHTEPQSSLHKEVRGENVQDAFSAVDNYTVYGKDLIVVDDVATTGATLHDAKRALQQGEPASILCVSLAH